MISFPNAKINFGLNITEKRKDGYHNIETVFYPVGLTDVLEIVENKENSGIEFTSTGITIPGSTSDNLCVKVYRKIQEEYSLPGVKIHLHKIIPIGAGLGGGSSDAAFLIKMVNAIFNLNLSEGEKLKYAKMAGSDCAFFIRNKVSFAEGRGDVLSTIDLNIKDFYLMIFNPGIHVSTAEAYDGVKVKQSVKDLRNIILENSIESWKERVLNNFEKSIFKKYPEIKALKEELYRAGAVFASMSGSGSSVFGLFKTKPKLDEGIYRFLVWEGK